MLPVGLSKFSRMLFSAVAIVGLAIPALAQITSTGIHGLVRDPSGAIVPGATIKLQDTSTGIEKATASSNDGVFAFANLQAGTYKLTATAPGFQTAAVNALTVDSGRTTDVNVDMKVGTSTETIDVSATATQLDVTSNEIGTTINNNLIQNLPYSGRDTLAFALLMPGNASANDPSGRNSTFDGLPNASMNISLDGMNNNSQRFKSGGTSFFQFAPSRLDAIEQLTVSTAGLGADAGGEGAMNIRLTTKRGTDHYHGKVLEQFRNEDLNANAYFNNLRGLPRNKVRENDAVGAIGGPLLPFIPYMKNRLFFFAYFEAIPQPGNTTSNGNVLTAASQAGNFTYIGTDGVQRTVNMLQAVGGTLDPTVKGILDNIAATQSKAATFVPISGQPYWTNMQWTQPTNSTTLYPTARVDYNISSKVAWHGTWNLRYNNIAGTPQYPGDPYDFVSAYKITTYVATNSVDWTIKPNLLNNFTFGVQSNGEYFYQGADPHQYSVYGNRIINIPFTAAGATINPYVPSTAWQPFIRNNPVFQWTDNVSWVRGKHTITLGGTALRTTFWETSFGSAGIPGYNFGIATSDPIATTLQNALPAINTSNGDLGNAQNLYALLTGRLTSITTTVNVDEKSHQYAQFAPVTQRFAFSTAGFYAQDSFRVKPSLTVNFGLRWQLDGSIHSTNGIDSEPTGANFIGPSNGPFQPGTLNGNLNPVYTQVSNAYGRDFKNFAPNVGFAWNPDAGSGLLGKLLGNRKTVIRGSFAMTYFNEGMNAISNVLSGGKGTTQSVSSNNGVQFAPGSLNLSSALPAFSVSPQSFAFPIAESAYTFNGGYNGNLVDPGLKSPYVSNWTLGIQRQLSKDTVFEVRYVGNKSTHLWHYQNIQETNIFENGFLNEFVQAKKNLDINTANGRTNTFANNGFAGQAALPIFDAAFGANASNAALAAGQGFGSTAFVTNLNQGVAGSFADTLATNTTYYCRMVGSNFAPCAAIGYTAPGKYPLNFFRMNPFLNAMNYQTDNGDTNYNALQLVLQHNYSNGLTLQANYTWAHTLGDFANTSDQTAGYQWYTTRNARLNYGPTPFDRRQVFNAYWTYDLPFGRGKKFSVTNPVLDRVVGGWTIAGRETIATGNPSLLSGGRGTFNNFTQPGVVLNGVTSDQLQHALSTVTGYFAGAKSLITDISSIATVTAAASSANQAIYGPASTPGQFGQFVYLRNNTQFQFDMSLNKDIRIHERWKMSLKAEALNFLNHPFFPLGTNSPTSTSFGQITTATGNRTVLLRGSVEW
jgi:hypothetical protein